MKLRKRITNPHGLKASLGINLVLAGLICAAVFSFLYLATETVLTRFFERSSFESVHIQSQGQNLQNYIDQNEVSSKTLGKLRKWEKRQPVILLELYVDDECIYSSFYKNSRRLESHLVEERLLSNRYNSVEIQLADMEATAVLYSDFTYQYYMIGMLISFGITLVLFIVIFLLRTGKIIRYICQLNDEVQILEGGNLDFQVTVQGNDEITDLARSMNRMKDSFREQMETEQKLYQANRQLVSEMSHDLRTPLTSILLYLEILRSHRYTSEQQLKQYLDKIESKAHHMKLLSDHLFEYTLEVGMEKQKEPLSMEPALKGTIDEFMEELTTDGYVLDAQLHWDLGFIQVKKEYLQRIFENITSNIRKYAQKAEPIRIETIEDDIYLGITVMNVCSEISEDIESNRIGIESIRTLMQQMNGSCTVEQTDTIFAISLMFPKQ